MHCGAQSLPSPPQLLGPPLLLAPYSGVTSGQLWGSLYITFLIEHLLSIVCWELGCCAGTYLNFWEHQLCVRLWACTLSGPGFPCEHLLCAWP